MPMSAWPRRRSASSPNATPAAPVYRSLTGDSEYARVSVVRRPEVVGFELCLGVRDDCADGFVNALGFPCLVGQRLEVFGSEEHQRARASSQICVQKGASRR